MSSIDEFLKTDLAFKKDLVPTASGDLDVISGMENVKEALFRRLITTPGTLIHRPEYGVNVKQFQGALNSLENQRKLAMSIQEQFEQDERVEKVLGVSIDSKNKTPDMVIVNVRVKIVGYGEASFGFVPFGDA